MPPPRARLQKGFVCALSGNRDQYQVPLALAEAGLLNRLVTDFYVPDGLPDSLLPAGLRNRRTPGLSSRLVTFVPGAFLLPLLGRLLRWPLQRIHPKADARIARIAGLISRKNDLPLYCYHHYIPERIAPGKRLILFVYHPLRKTDLGLLMTDAENFPEAAHSLATEREAMAAQEVPIDWNRVDAVVCASSFTARSVVLEGCEPAKITVIPYGIPSVPAPRPRPQEGDSGPNFLFVGQGVQRKGLHHLIRAWQLKDRGNAQLTIVSYAIDPRIKALIGSPSIRLLGYQDKASLDELFASADAFIMPSLVEGFGMVYLEALAHGCHLIGTPNTGLPDLGLPPEALTLVKTGDLDSISVAIDECQSRCAAGGFDRNVIYQFATRWSQERFRNAVARHAAEVLREKKGTA